MAPSRGRPPPPRELAAEAFAAAAIVLLAAGTQALEGPTGGGSVSVALAYGAAVLVAGTALPAPDMGNPALAVAAWILGRRDAPATAAVVGAQLGGAVVAGLALWAALPHPLASTAHLGAALPPPGLSPWTALAAEAGASF
ncbi:MAG TPA: aquaporin, partial [Actinomycetota bacterium]|nr:aquaporin [Actinomycetota bacterium]